MVSSFGGFRVVRKRPGKISGRSASADFVEVSKPFQRRDPVHFGERFASRHGFRLAVRDESLGFFAIDSQILLCDLHHTFYFWTPAFSRQPFQRGKYLQSRYRVVL